MLLVVVFRLEIALSEALHLGIIGKTHILLHTVVHMLGTYFPSE